jgi:hypothetical protein
MTVNDQTCYRIGRGLELAEILIGRSAFSAVRRNFSPISCIGLIAAIIFIASHAFASFWRNSVQVSRHWLMASACDFMAR